MKRIYANIPIRETFVCLLIGIFLAGFWLAMLPAQTAAQNAQMAGSPTFSISPFYNARLANHHPRPYFIYTAPQNTSLNDSVHVQNSGTARGSVALYSVDALTAPASGISFHAHHDPRRDVGAWISIDGKPLTLGPGQSMDIPFRLHIPQHVRPGQHYGGIVAEPIEQETAQASKADQTALNIHIRSLFILGMQVNIPGKTSEHLQAGEVHYDQQSRYQRMLLTLKNTGTQTLHPLGQMQITDQQGKLLQTIPLKLHAFLPQTTIDYPIYMHATALTLGHTYNAKLHLSYAHNQTLEETTSFTLPRPSNTIPLPAVISNLIPSPSLDEQMTPEHFVVAAVALFLLLTACLFWGPRLYKATRGLQQKLARHGMEETRQAHDED